MVRSVSLPNSYRLLGRGKYTEVFLDKEHLQVIKEAKNKAVQSVRYIQNEYEKLEVLNSSFLSPKVFSLEENEDGIPSLVMEYVEGKTLRQILDESEGLGEKLSKEIAKTILEDLINNLFRLHSKFKMAHFDLSPDNILISREDNKLYFIDFSLARFEKEFQLMEEPVGKVDYMAPEIYEKEFGFFSDVYALGIICEEVIKNSEQLNYNEKINFLIASMKLPKFDARITIDEVYHQFNTINMGVIKRQTTKKSNWIYLLIISAAFFLAYVLINSDSPKTKSKSSIQKKYKAKKKLSRIKKASKKRRVSKKYIKKTNRKVKYKMNQDTKNIFKRIIK